MKDLIQAFYQIIGNKRYMREVEELLTRMEAKAGALEPKDKQALRYLINDLRQLKIDQQRY